MAAPPPAASPSAAPGSAASGGAPAKTAPLINLGGPGWFNDVFEVELVLDSPRKVVSRGFLFEQQVAVYKTDDVITGKVVVKLDVQGMELIVAPSAILRGVICEATDAVFGEWNFTKGLAPILHNPVTGQGTLTSLPFDNMNSAAVHFDQVWKAKVPADCKAKWMGMVNDEKHLIQEDAPLPHAPY